MQCQRPAWRAVCRASKAYNASLALRAAFSRTATRYRDDDARIPSAWEPTEWEELPRGQQEEQQHTVQQEDRPPFASDQPERCFSMKRRKHPVRPHHDDENGKGKRSGEESPTNEESSHLDSLRASLVAQAKRLERHRRPCEDADMSEDRYWQPTTTGHRVTDAETWKQGIGNLVSLNRELRTYKQNKGELDTNEQALMKAAFDYLPYAVLPRAPAQGDTSLPLPPWEQYVHPSNARHEDKLSKEIALFAAFMKPTRLERVARQAAVKELLAFVRGVHHPDAPTPTAAEVHGSEKTGLAMPTSDIDIRVWAQGGTLMTGKSKHAYARIMRHRMNTIHKALLEDRTRFSLVTMREGLHPIINCQHIPSGIDVQIVSTNSTRPQEEVTRHYLAKFPGLHDLFIVIRTALEVRGLLPAYNGGTGAYGCFVMLLPPLLRLLPKVDPDMSAPRMLREFLSFYDPCYRINPARHGLACHPRQVFLKHKADASISTFARLAQLRGDSIRAGRWRMCQINEFQPYLLTLQDPATAGNDLGARIHAIKHVIATIKRLRSELRYSRKKSIASRTYRPFLSTVVGRPDILYRNQRRTLKEYGCMALENGFVPDSEEGSEGSAAGSPIRRIWIHGQSRC